MLKVARELHEGQEPPGPNNTEAFRVHLARTSLPADLTNKDLKTRTITLARGPTNGPGVHAV